jgi:hypothetical protein
VLGGFDRMLTPERIKYVRNLLREPEAEDTFIGDLGSETDKHLPYAQFEFVGGILFTWATGGTVLPQGQAYFDFILENKRLIEKLANEFAKTLIARERRKVN